MPASCSYEEAANDLYFDSLVRNQGTGENCDTFVVNAWREIIVSNFNAMNFGMRKEAWIIPRIHF